MSYAFHFHGRFRYDSVYDCQIYDDDEGIACNTKCRPTYELMNNTSVKGHQVPLGEATVSVAGGNKFITKHYVSDSDSACFHLEHHRWTLNLPESVTTLVWYTCLC